MKQTLPGVFSILVLVASAGIGIAQIFKPDWFIKRSDVRRGGEMVREYNRSGIQMLGLVVAGIAIYKLYSLFRH